MGKSIKMRVFTAVVLSLCFTASLSQEAEDSERAGRIFYVTTTSSISTIQSISFCYVPTSNLVLVTCSGRRKRANTILSGADGGLDSDISPSAPRSSDSIEEEPESDVETSRRKICQLLDHDHLHLHHHRLHGDQQYLRGDLHAQWLDLRPVPWYWLVSWLFVQMLQFIK